MKGPNTHIDPLDIEIGGRIRIARKARGMAQVELAEALGLSFQQIQKYERGVNRVSSSALVVLAGILKVSPTELLGPPPEERSDSFDKIDWDLLGEPGAFELLSSYRRIVSPSRRRLVVELAEQLADEVEG